jgi:hypothetical protein
MRCTEVKQVGKKNFPPWRKDMVFIGDAVLADVMKV